MKSDLELRQDVLDELEWEPSIDAARIGVAAHDGVVTLSGDVKTYTEKLTAERATEPRPRRQGDRQRHRSPARGRPRAQRLGYRPGSRRAL